MGPSFFFHLLFLSIAVMKSYYLVFYYYDDSALPLFVCAEMDYFKM